MVATQHRWRGGRTAPGETAGSEALPFSASPWAIPLVLVLITALGFAIRAATVNQGLFGDELSTAWIVHGRGLGTVLSYVYSDKEVTPPLSFVLSWLSLKVGSAWWWLRLPSLLAGTATIPIVYAIGVRTANRAAGLVAATVIALSAVMIMFSTEARNYALMMACVAGSTLALLIALDTRRTRWWVVYAVVSCLAMYSHYSAAFPLLVQAVWVLWRHPEARRAALLANLGAALAYGPWIPGWIHDTHSVTVPIINAVLPFDVGFVAHSVAEWAVGYPYLSLQQAPGQAFALLIVAGVLVAAVGVAARLAGTSGAWSERVRGVVNERVVLMVLLALSTLVGEALYSALRTHVLDSRDLNASLPALAVCIGVLISAARPPLSWLACALVLSGYAAGAVDTLQARYQRPNNPAAARFIERHARRGDVVVDASNNAPVVPLTPLGAYLPPGHRVFTLGLPEGPPPYTLASKVPPGNLLLGQATRAAGRSRIFLVTGSVNGEGSLNTVLNGIATRSGASQALRELSRQYRVIRSSRFPGVENLTVWVLGPRRTVRSGGSRTGT